MIEPNSSDYDIIIAGGGMIGTCMALALAPLRMRVAVVEAVARSAATQPSFDDRSTALSRSSQRMFQAMGLWNDIAASSTPIRKIHVSEKGRFGFAHIEAEEQGVEALGYVVINRVLGDVLQSALKDVANLDFICPASVTALHTSTAGVVARVAAGKGERTLSGRLLVAADGAESSVRQLLGIGATHVDYGQCAIVGNLLPNKPHERSAFERFTRLGPLALLPLADRRAAFVWAVTAAHAERLMQLPDATFTRELQENFGLRLGQFDQLGRRSSYPLKLSKAHRLTTECSVLVGNAAHGLHPVAAQGFNLGLRDVAALCDCIADELQAADGTTAIGAPRVLEAYSEWRRDDHRKVVQFTDGLVRLFAAPQRSVRMMRNLGMLTFDLLPGVRRQFARHTMGLAGRLPRLSRGVPLG